MLPVPVLGSSVTVSLPCLSTPKPPLITPVNVVSPPVYEVGRCRERREVYVAVECLCAERVETTEIVCQLPVPVLMKL